MTSNLVRYRKSPLWKLWRLWFPNADLNQVYIACGRFVSAPEGGKPDGDLIVHEMKHLAQQGHSYWGAIMWHLHYRFSATFRLEQEVEACREQIRFISSVMGREKASYYTRKLAEMLASPMYGNMCTYAQAYKRLTQAP